MRILFDAYSLQSQAHLTHERVKGRRLASLLEMLRELEPGTTAEFLPAPYNCDALAGVDVLVWTTRTRPLREAEMDAVVEFVKAGGGLWNLSNHDPHHVEGARLAARFGVHLDGAYLITHGAWTRIEGAHLADHPLLGEWEDGPAIRTLATNTTDAIRAEVGEPVAFLPESMESRIPLQTPPGGMYAHALEGGPAGAGRVLTVADSGFLGSADTRYPGQGLLDQGDNLEFARRSVLWLARRERFGR